MRAAGTGRLRAALAGIAALWLASHPSLTAHAAPDEVTPDYIRGYVTALLERSYDLHPAALEVEGTTLTVRFAREPRLPLDKLERSLLSVEGVERVRLLAGETVLLEGERDAAALEPAASEGTPTEAEGASNGAGAADRDGWDVFPSRELFDPLLADPRWPHFSASHQWYLGDEELERVAAVSFGETFSLVRSPQRDWGEWELAFQAGVFSVFDLESSSFDLVNSDFFVGLASIHHVGDFTTMLRAYHQSSHLGDEYLLRSRVDRVNLSFEVLDLLVSFEPWRWLRLYGGGGLMVHREPALGRGITELGLELWSPVALAGGYLRPVAGLDVQHREESDWKTDLSLRTGVQIEHPVLADRRLQILAEYYDGRSPNGQFFERRIRELGIGIHLGF